MKEINVDYSKDACIVSGKITFDNVMYLYRQTFKYFIKATKIQFDFAHLTAADSSAVALLIEWIKIGKEHNVNVKFANLPKNMHLLIQIGGIEAMLAKHIIN